MKSPVPVLMMVRELNLGGIERDVSKLARHIDPTRFTPHVASYLPAGARFQELAVAGIPILHLPVESLFSAAALKCSLRFRRYIAEHGIRIVHTFDGPTDLFGMPLARLFGVPVAVASQLWVHPIHPRWYARALVSSYRLATSVYVNCQAVKTQLVEEKGLAPEKIYICNNGVETAIFYPPRETRQMAYTESTVLIGTIAVLRPEKDLATLLKAFALVHGKHTNARLVIAGAGPMSESLEALGRELRLGEACRFLPPPESVAGLMRKIDIFVLPSLSEAFSNALLEAMACGCCPVGSRVGGTPELIADGERGMLFEPGNAEDLAARLSLLVEYPELRHRFSEASVAFAHGTLDIRVAAGRLADHYTALLERARVE